MPPAKQFVVKWRAFIPPTPHKGGELLGVGRDTIPATTVQAAMELALKLIPMRIHQPGCSIAVLSCKEKKDGQKSKVDPLPHV